MAQQLREGSILIVCEGEKTENYFLADLYSLLVEKDLCAIDYPDIVPAPVRDTDVDKIPSNRKRGGRCMNKATRQVKAEPVLLGSVLFHQGHTDDLLYCIRQENGCRNTRDLIPMSNDRIGIRNQSLNLSFPWLSRKRKASLSRNGRCLI